MSKARMKKLWPVLDRGAAIGARLANSRKGIALYETQLDAIERTALAILTELGLPARRSRWAVNDALDRYIELGPDEAPPEGWAEFRFCPEILGALTPGCPSGTMAAGTYHGLYHVLDVIAHLREAVAIDPGWKVAQLGRELDVALSGFGQIVRFNDEASGRRQRAVGKTGAEHRAATDKERRRQQRNARWRAAAERMKDDLSLPSKALLIMNGHNRDHPEERVTKRTVESVLRNERG